MLKKILLSFLLLIVFTIQAQQSYTFDYKLKITTYNKKQRKEFGDLIYYYNSKDSSYTMQLYNNIDGKLFVHQENKLAFYKFNSSANKGEINFTDFKEYSLDGKLNINKIIVEKLGENKYSIFCFEKEESKKPSLKLIVNLKLAETNLIRFYYFDSGYKIEKMLIDSLQEKLGDNYIIEDYTVDYMNGFAPHCMIEKIEKINQKITIP
ncbi:hypothetical protein [Chryseobacterium sp. G0201]|uniref:hypothetical protein n=1 Tax=Chryseobacterium sp. G0201 TaxID=2487065 RepID=UPI000F6EDE41|nr:hypothetical protein [Chryseobacterium sp. G0201]AZA54342.1 hypothetical protein EG348_15760 [Chryseobacterium sp. G0201]